MELRDLYDENKELTGETIYKGQDVPKGRYYITVVVFIQNSKNEFLIQKRVKKKDGKWATTGGHPVSGETSKQGIITEIKEELGVDIVKENIKLFKTIKTEDDFVDIYYLKEDIDIKKIKIQKEEVEDVKWATIEEIKEVAENYNIKINQEKIKQIMWFTKDEIIEYLFKGNSEKGNEFITKCQENENKYLKKNGGHIYKNTIKTIKDLSNNYNLYIVSNCQSGYIEAFLEHYSIEKYFKDYECSGNTGLSKEKNIKELIKRNKIAKAIYVGDTKKDCESANMNGLHFIWAEYGFGKCDKYYKKIEDISELINMEI